MPRRARAKRRKLAASPPSLGAKIVTEDVAGFGVDSEEFLTRIKYLEVEADEVMVSFDVISLFTSIPPALAIDTIDGFLREKYDETDQQLKRAHIIELLELCLKTFFTFNGQVYEQVYRWGRLCLD
ncbi:hypothetical protein SprV_0501995600 [Sparganum proliferum]